MDHPIHGWTVMVMSRSLPGAVQGIKKSTNFNVDRKYNFTSGGIYKKLGNFIFHKYIYIFF